MDSNSTRLCRLCFKTNDELVNVFETFQHSTIASVLTQHFWFKVDKNDGYPECLCEICWINVKTFHNFYKRVELLHRNYSVNLEGTAAISAFDLSKQERSDSVSVAALEPDLNIVKCEETELQERMIESLNYNDYNDDNSCNQSENEQTSDDEDQPSNRKRKSYGPGDITIYNDTENKTLSPGIGCESSSEEDDFDKSHSPGIECESSSKEDDFDKSHQSSSTQPISNSEEDKEAARICEFSAMKCDICSDVKFETLRKAKKHYRTVHNKIGYLTCCGKKLDRRNLILDHIKHHLNPDSFRCELCAKRFENSGGLKTHIATHNTKTLPRSHKCSLCAKAFSRPSSLAQHKRFQHSLEKDQKFHCEKCNKNYPTKYALTFHFRRVHELNNTLVCEICARICTSKQVYREHMQDHSGITRPKAQCNICGAWLVEHGLRSHLKRHEADSVNCTICNKVLQNKYLLKVHIRSVHSVERRHKCTLCGKAFRYPRLLKSDWFLNRRYYGHLYEFWFIYDWGQESCRITYNSSAIQEVLKSNVKYDVILMETFNTDCLMGVVWKLQAPVIALSSCNLMPWHYDRVGNPHIPSFIPSLFMEHSDKMTFVQRLTNFIDIHLMKSLYRLFVDGYTDKMLTHIFGDKIPSVAELRKQTSLMFVNSHFSLSGVRPLSPAVIELGGIHIKEAKPLKTEIKNFLDNSHEGVIFVSWGSMVKADTMSVEVRDSMLQAFGSFKQKFLWKWENDTLPNKPKNVYIHKWLQQREILCHPNVKAFVSHGGLLGSSEAAHCGVPVIITPMYGDQFLNAAQMVRRGMGTVVHYEHITKETMRKAIQFALNSQTQMNAKTVSHTFNNRILPPLKTAMWWVEFTAATKGTPLIQSHSVHMTGYEYHLLDVYGVIALGISMMILSWIWVFYWFCCAAKINRSQKVKKH